MIPLNELFSFPVIAFALKNGRSETAPRDPSRSSAESDNWNKKNLEFGAYSGLGAAASPGPQQGLRELGVAQIPGVGGLGFRANHCVSLFCSGPLKAEVGVRTRINAIPCVRKFFFFPFNLVFM